MLNSLRLRLPLLLLLFVIGAAALTLLIALPLQNRAIEARGVEQARHQSHLVQSGLASILRHGDLADARSYLASITADAGISRVLLLDSEERVLLDPARGLQKQLVRDTLGADLRVAFKRVLMTRSGDVAVTNDGNTVHGLYPVNLGRQDAGPRPARDGVLSIEWDLSAQKRVARHFMLVVVGSMVGVMCALTVVLGVVLDRSFSAPVRALLRTAQAIANGQRQARAEVGGSSEFVALANALNTVTASLIGQQKDLAERELQLRLSHEFAGTGTFEWSIKDNLVRGTRHFWMNFFGEQLNAPIPYSVGLNSVFAADRAVLDEALHACAMVGAPLDVHFRCRDRDGLLHCLHLAGNAERDADGCARRIVALTRDETEEVAAREVLRATSRELEYQKYALDQHSIVAITDVRGIITYVNDKFCAVSGYGRDELLGHAHSLVKSDAHPPEFYRDMWRTISAGRVWRGEMQNRRKDGGDYWVDTTIVPHFDADSRIDGYISMRTDITARVIGERERERLQQQLYQTQKVEALGLLSGGIAHDFNNLLAAIVGHAELAKRRFGNQVEDRLTVYLNEITAAAERGRDLVQRLLTFSHGSVEQVSALSLASEIREALRIVRPLLPGGITLISDLDDGIPPVEVSASQVQQMVMNLCVNAREAMHDQGLLHLALHHSRRHGTCAACGVNFDGDFVSIQFEDSGAGISADILDRIFDPFFTTKAVGEGSGLGLSVVHGIVHQAGGHIVVTAGASGGSCFEILFAPCAAGSRREETGKTAPQRPSRPALEHSV